MKVMTAKAMRAADQNTLKQLKMTNLALMKRAGYLLVKDFLQRVHPRQNEIIHLIAGHGNNGGDTLIMASELLKLGYRCEVFIIGETKKANSDFNQLIEGLVSYITISSSEQLSLSKKQLLSCDYIIDGLFGCGLDRHVEGYRAELIDILNDSQAVIYAVDLPSGIDPDSGLVMGYAVKADYTGVVGAYKLGNLMNEALDYSGESVFLDIGIIDDDKNDWQFIDLSNYDYKAYQPRFSDHKYTIGQGIFIGGHQGMMGSIQMAAISGLKSGLGIVKVLTSEQQHIPQFYPEIVIDQTMSEDIDGLIRKSKVFVYGPGLGDQLKNKPWLQRLLESDKPLVVDGSGLDDLDLKKVSNPNVVLTPHAGEMARMFNVDTKTVLKDSLFYLDQLTDLGFHVVLKGPCTVAASVKKRRFMQSKNPGLATAGSGDVFAGILAACLAHQAPYESMLDAIYIHSLAGEYAKQQKGLVSMTATDIINHLHEVFMKEESS